MYRLKRRIITSVLLLLFQLGLPSISVTWASTPFSEEQIQQNQPPIFRLTDQARQPLSGLVLFCESSIQTLQEIQRLNACRWQPVDTQKLPRGFSSKTHWLQFRLSNPENLTIERWLEVGHPRMQRVTLYQQDNDEWQEQHTGQQIPLQQRPLRTSRLLIPLQMHPRSITTFYLQVEAETHIDHSIRLWKPDYYFAQQSKSQILQALAMGGLLLASVFTWMLFVRSRDVTTLWLSLTFLVQVVLDASYTGLLSAYFWPDHLPYEIRLHGVMVGLMVLFFMQFVRSFLKTPTLAPFIATLIRIAQLLTLLSIAAIILWQFAIPIRVISILALVFMLGSVWLFYRAWRQGSGPAGYLLISYLLLLIMVAYRAGSSFGWLGQVPLQEFGFSWYFLLITPTTLQAILRQSDELSQQLIQAEADRSAHKLFLAQMSHELRSPLNIIMGQAGLLKTQMPDDNVSLHQVRSPLQRETLIRADAILSSSKRLLSMIDEILDYSRAIAGQLKLSSEPVQLNAFIDELHRDYQPHALNAGNQLKFDISSTSNVLFSGDERRLRQVLDNLLNNANRYCRNGTVTFSVTQQQHQPDQCHIRFSVRDTGPGIPLAEQHKVFEPFQRGSDANNYTTKGTGLGLTITRQLVELMGGSLYLHSDKGQGCHFWFELKLPLYQTVEDNRLIPTQKQEVPRILLVDDDPEQLSLIRQMLAPLGFKLFSAASATDAKIHSNQGVNLVITDQFMRHGDGWQILLDWYQSCPVLLMSTAPAQKPFDFPSEINFTRELLKPVTQAALFKTLNEILLISETSSICDVSTQISCISVEGIPAYPPAELQAQLEHLVTLGSISEIEEWQQNLAAERPEYQAFCQEVSAAVSRLDLEYLAQLVKRCKADDIDQ